MPPPDLPDGMKVVCAWCRRLLRGHVHAHDVSHGICSDCCDRLLSPSAVPIRATPVDLRPREGWCDAPIVHEDPYVDLGGEAGDGS